LKNRFYKILVYRRFDIFLLFLSLFVFDHTCYESNNGISRTRGFTYDQPGVYVKQIQQPLIPVRSITKKEQLRLVKKERSAYFLLNP